MRRATQHEAPVEGVEVDVLVVPTDRPESDGTIAWDRTTMVVVHVRAAGAVGLGYTYSHAAAATLIRETLEGVVRGVSALDVGRAHDAMVRAVRNVGRRGVAARAISALDCALWDLKGKLLGRPVLSLLGARRDEVAIYGSGGFTSYDDDALAAQLAGWVDEGIPRVKMKVGRDPARDPERVALVRRAIGAAPELYVDANGAWTPKQALAQVERFTAQRVSWLEEPVSSDDLAGLRRVRDGAPASVEVAAGEYAGEPLDAARMLEADAVDVLMPDVTRCGGITGFLAIAALADVRGIPLSTHCAPALSLHVACAAPRVRHVEWFHDHARIESMLLEGAPSPAGGTIAPDLDRPGLGLELKRRDAARFATSGE